MKKKSSIIKLCIIGVALIYGLILSFVSFEIGLTDFNSTASSIKLGLDLKGGIYAVYEMDDTDTTNLSSRMDGTRTRLLNLLTSKSYTEATVVREGQTRLRVEVPDVDDPGNIFELIGRPASLKFVLEDGTIVITGKNVESATVGYQDGESVVSLRLDKDGTDAFGKATSENVGKSMSIMTQVSGEEEKLVSTVNIEVAILSGEAVISGIGSPEAAKDLADQITSGQFEVRLALLESNTVSPTLGEKALFYGVIAGAIGLFLVMIFLCVVYRGLGFAASIALIFYTILMLLFLAILPWTQLTLPGIAGIILSLGMAVDANIIIFERIKDEYRNGKSVLASTYAGFKKATKAIIDSNVTTIIAAVVLLIFGTGSIQGFALTLLLGIVLSLFTSLFISRKLVKYFINTLTKKPRYDEDADAVIAKNTKFLEKMFGLKQSAAQIDSNKDQNDSDKNSKTNGGLAHENI